MIEKKAIVLLSGGLDSATVLALVASDGYQIYPISFDYGQLHKHELLKARLLAKKYGASARHRTIAIDLSIFGGSALTDATIPVPLFQKYHNEIPTTYVPARNLIFLSMATGYAETIGASDIFIGVNHIDYSNYPDCRPEFIASFTQSVNLGTKGGIMIHTPLIEMSKVEIIKLGMSLNLDYSLTSSCYQPNKAGEACRRCDACHLRLEGFRLAGCEDRIKYA